MSDAHAPQLSGVGGAADTATRRLVDLAPARAALLTFIVLAAVFGATATYDTRQSLDAASTALPAWRLAAHGELALDDVQPTPRVPWFEQTDHGIVSNRAPGIIAFALPWYAAYALFSDELSLVPAGIASAAAAAGAMALLHLVFRRLTDARTALAATAVAALATATWSVSADALWPHTVDQLWLCAAMLALAAGRHGVAGVHLGLAVLSRPVLAVAAAIIGMMQTVFERSPRPVVLIGVGSASGLVALVLYNYAVFGALSVTGGYSSAFGENLTGMAWTTYLLNLWGTLADPLRGVLVWSPFLLPLVLGLRDAWRASPDWVRATTLASVAYMLVHLRLNRYSGGDTFWSYRYPIESLTLAAPLLLRSYTERIAARRGLRRLFWTLVVVSVALHLMGAIAFPHSLDAPAA